MRIDDQVPEIAQKACEKCRALLGDNLTSFALYGSAVRGNMVRGSSDINVLIVLEHSTPEAHRVIAGALKSLPQIAPFVLSHRELLRSMRVFALKFGSIGRNYRVLFGIDPFADFAPSQSLMLFLCEQSLNNLQLRLKHQYMRNIDKPSRYGQVLVHNITALFITLAEVLRCAGIPVPEDFESRAGAIGVALNADTSVLAELLELRKNPGQRMTADRTFDLHERLFRLLSASLDKVREQWPQATEIQ